MHVNRRSAARLCAAAAALFALSSFTVAARAASDGRALLVPVDRLIRAIDAGSGSGIAAAYVLAPTIVDEFAPYRWTGDGAARHWSRDFAAVARDASLTRVRVVRHAPAYVSSAGGRAWLVVPTEYHYDLAGKPQLETAAWTFVLVRADGAWHIEASTWAKTAGAP